MSSDGVSGGEEAIIQEFLAPLARDFPGAFGLKDDCALLTPEPGTELVLKTDPVRAGIHFFPDDPPADIAWKALAMNVSDLVAKGARPLAYLAALSFSETPRREWMAQFARGLGEAQAAFGCHLIGGDTDKAPGPLSIAITAIGVVPRGRMVRRGTARAGDVLFVSGTIGDSAMGLYARSNGFARRFWPLDEAERAWLEQRYRRPQPRLALTSALIEHASAAMDVSDGLVKDLDRMARASGVGARVEMMRVPLSVAGAKVAASVPEWRLRAMTGGDDYEVLAAVPATRADGFKADAAAAGVVVTAIGQFEGDAGVRVLGPDGAPVAVDRTGWDHF
ncbi:MAG: thiamine-phosphate kinase [Hyphomicrobiales bacterium]|nr:thiamine-phosphate kinase [Hyphomicrobiales bacterium]